MCERCILNDGHNYNIKYNRYLACLFQERWVGRLLENLLGNFVRKFVRKCNGAAFNSKEKPFDIGIFSRYDGVL